jgi:hypothetical protein
MLGGRQRAGRAAALRTVSRCAPSQVRTATIGTRTPRSRMLATKSASTGRPGGHWRRSAEMRGRCSGRRHPGPRRRSCGLQWWSRWCLPAGARGGGPGWPTVSSPPPGKQGVRGRLRRRRARVERPQRSEDERPLRAAAAPADLCGREGEKTRRLQRRRSRLRFGLQGRVLPIFGGSARQPCIEEPSTPQSVIVVAWQDRPRALDAPSGGRTPGAATRRCGVPREACS